MQQTLGWVENWELKVQGEQGEHRLRTEEKGEKGPGAELYHSPTIHQAPCRVTIFPIFAGLQDSGPCLTTKNTEA